MPGTLGKGLIGIAIVALSFWLTLALLDPGSGDPSAGKPAQQGEPNVALAPSWKDWNEALYLAVNPDVAAAIARGEFKSGRQHYELAGITERRSGATIPRDWDEAKYLETNPDVAAAVKMGSFISGYHHYLAAGRTEKRLGGFPPGRSSSL